MWERGEGGSGEGCGRGCTQVTFWRSRGCLCEVGGGRYSGEGDMGVRL